MVNRKKSRDSAFLQEYKGPCPVCGYKLEKPSSSRCPECGSQLRVVLVAPYRLSPWHAMVISIAISIGVILDRIALTIVGIINSNSMIMAWEMFWFSVIPFVVLCFCLFIVWKYKNRINSKSRWKRVSWYFVACIIPLVVTGGQLFLLLVLALRV
jgi:hypothetical protein